MLAHQHEKTKSVRAVVQEARARRRAALADQSKGDAPRHEED